MATTLTEDKLEHVRYGGEHGDWGELLRQLVDEIRTHRRQIADLLGAD